MHHGHLRLLHHLLLPVDDAITEPVCLTPISCTKTAASKRVPDPPLSLHFQVPVLMRPGQLPLHSVLEPGQKRTPKHHDRVFHECDDPLHGATTQVGDQLVVIA